MMSLVVPLLQSQIDAAQRLYRRLAMWRATNDAFGVLQQTLPGFDLHASLIKAAAVNQLYGTNVFAITRMAQHIVIVMQHRGGTPVDLSLVEEIATLRDSVEEAKPRRHLSSASKFAHFFISDTLFPIYDSYAAMILNYHMRGRATAPDSAPPYADYVAALKHDCATVPRRTTNAAAKTPMSAAYVRRQYGPYPHPLTHPLQARYRLFPASWGD